MGGASSSQAHIKGVPMPPTAWALASIWSAVWEAPRFRASSAPLRREDVAPLLKIAASCLAALLPHVGRSDRRSQLPPFGASRELLVAALDGAPDGAPLATPSNNPRGFVQALVRAAFRTGDGDFVEGLSEECLQHLLEEHCPTQLQNAANLLQDPSSSLQAALEAATGKIQEVVRLPPTAGNLAGVADRLLLVQRLERLRDEAAGLLEVEALKKRQEDETQDADVEMQPTDGELCGGTSISAAGQDAAVEDQSESSAAPVSIAMTAGAKADATEESEVLTRTKSQIAASVKVNKVKKHIDESHAPIHELARTASRLARNTLPQDSEVAALQAELETVDQARKRARNFGEDLVEDMLALDSLHNLDPEDRSTRKAAIAGIESLLDDVDAAKSRLNILHSSLQDRLEETHPSVAKQQEAQPARAAPVKSVFAPAPPRGAISARTPEAQPEPAALRPASSRSSSSSSRGKNQAAADALALETPLPTKDDWRRVRLPLRFHSREEVDHYLILATMPGLDTEELKLDLSDDSSTLTVHGLRVPAPQEAARMQQRITARILALAQQAPQRFAATRGSLGQAIHEAYVELGQDEFVRFSVTFRLPEDVDVAAIDASYRDGVLRVVLPRLAPPPAPDRFSSVRGGRYGHGRRGQPTMGFPGPAAGQQPMPLRRRSPGLFGGLDDSFYW